MGDHALQARELLDEIRLMTATVERMDWRGRLAERQEMDDTLRLTYADAVAMLSDEMPEDEGLRLCTYDLIVSLREWRENMDWVMEQVPGLRRGGDDDAE